MIFPTIGDAATYGLESERTRVELATFRLAIANAHFSSRGEAIDFLKSVQDIGLVSSQGVENELDREISALWKPDDPLADAEGFVYRVVVDPTREMATLVSATRAYEANIRAYNVNGELTRAALKIGGGN